VNANAREVLCAVLDHDSYALQHGFMSPRLQYAAIAYRNATTADAARSLKEDATRVEHVGPDLDALNAAVAEAVRVMVQKGRWATGSGLEDIQRVVNASRALDAALAMKPRYVVEPNSTVPVRVVVYDTHESRPLSPPEVAALLNAKEKP
jgi:hypothetical protein